MNTFGMQQQNWNVLTKMLVYALFVFNSFACYARPDFLTQMVCVVSLYFLNSEVISQSMFRMLPLAILVSFIYDIVYLFYLQNLAREGT